MKKICSAAGIEGYKTNHSLRATCATRLFQQNVDEQLIMSRTGHRSVKGVRSYKRATDIHHHNTSVVIDCKSMRKDFNPESRNPEINFHFYQGCNVVINNNKL